MPLVSTEVWVVLSPNNITYYEELAYKILRRKNGRVARGTKLLININHLPKHSNVKVEILCPECKTTRWISNHNFNKHSDICNVCNGKLRGINSKGKKRPNSTGELHHNYKGNSGVNKLIRSSIENIAWRGNIYQQQKFTCQNCNQVSGKLNVHHIVNLASLIEAYNINKTNYLNYKHILFDEDNGCVLCKDCHTVFHKKYGYTNNTRKQLEDFIDV